MSDGVRNNLIKKYGISEIVNKIVSQMPIEELEDIVQAHIEDELSVLAEDLGDRQKFLNEVLAIQTLLNGRRVLKRLPYSHEKGCPKADTPETLKESLYCTCKSNWELNNDTT
tara:strand:- start:2651 stop:2989 length:339 start_codon:yes stop_codon:yes gene_type:complete